MMGCSDDVGPTAAPTARLLSVKEGLGALNQLIF